MPEIKSTNYIYTHNPSELWHVSIYLDHLQGRT